jgi:hypothetical protein
MREPHDRRRSQVNIEVSGAPTRGSGKEPHLRHRIQVAGHQALMRAPRLRTALRFGDPIYASVSLCYEARWRFALDGFCLTPTNGPRNPDRIIKGVVQAATLGCRIDGASLPGISIVANQERRPLAR